MFDDTIVEILGNNHQNTKIKSILVDVQEYDKDVKIGNYTINGYKRLYPEIEPLITVGTYLKIENEIVQVVKINKYTDYMEVFVSKFENIKINNIDKSLIIEDDCDKRIDYKTVISNDILNTGDMVEYNNQKWLIIGEVSQNGTIYKATMRKCHHILKFYVNNRLCETPSIVEISPQTIQTGQIISTADGKIELFIQDTIDNRNLTYSSRFLMMGSPWKIEGTTRELTGLIHIFVTKGIFNEFDNKDLEIADYYKYNVKHSYVMNIVNTDFSYNIGETTQLDVNVTDNAIVVNNPSLTYSSLNPSIATVSTTGLITSINQGSTTIVVTFTDANNTIITKEINITVLEPVAEKTLKLNGSNELYNASNSVNNYSITYEDDSPVLDKSFTWTIDDLSLSVFVAGSVTSTSCKLKAKTTSSTGFIVLTAICNEDNNIRFDFDIYVRYIF